MKIYNLIILFNIVLLTFSARLTYAQNIYSESASLRSRERYLEYDYRVENLKKFFENYNSPLASYAKEFVKYADDNNLDYRLVPAITGVESTFGKNIPHGSYNAYGWANGDYKFRSWTDSISKVSESLKISYIDRGALTIKKIARIYAPPSLTWEGKVNYFIKKIDSLPINFDII